MDTRPAAAAREKGCSQCMTSDLGDKASGPPQSQINIRERKHLQNRLDMVSGGKRFSPAACSIKAAAGSCFQPVQGCSRLLFQSCLQVVNLEIEGGRVSRGEGEDLDGNQNRGSPRAR